MISGVSKSLKLKGAGREKTCYRAGLVDTCDRILLMRVDTGCDLQHLTSEGNRKRPPSQCWCYQSRRAEAVGLNLAFGKSLRRFKLLFELLPAWLTARPMCRDRSRKNAREKFAGTEATMKLLQKAGFPRVRCMLRAPVLVLFRSSRN